MTTDGGQVCQSKRKRTSAFGQSIVSIDVIPNCFPQWAAIPEKVDYDIAGKTEQPIEANKENYKRECRSYL
ncbi:hypothetical protein [Alloalcanivorax xenomutans]|jgi:hypothetical protein|uniref:hypothetical protein n=1 Tax=Alloalcanivorax xenomutans TaxID=1094342 RepID=UPI0011AB5F8E|nr:hypothetical protein [Alloalcanivorax xenomutans]